MICHTAGMQGVNKIALQAQAYCNSSNTRRPSEAGMADPEASGRRVRRHTETPTVLTAAAESFRASEGAYERVCDNFRLLRRK